LISVPSIRRPFDHRPSSLTISVALFTAAICLPSVARAQAQAESRTLAQSLFDEGRRLVNAGDYAQGCSKLEESERLDPGVGTQLNIANCYELAGRSASAWSAYAEAASAARAAGQSDREDYARERGQALEQGLARLTIVLSARRLKGLLILRNGHALDGSALGTPVAVDPGEYRLAASAPGHRDWSTTLHVQPGDKTKIEIPELEPLRSAEASASPARAAGRRLATAQGKTALIAAGAGLVSLGFGGAFALAAKSRYNGAMRDYCGGGSCSPRAYDETAAARRQGNWATALVVAGGVAMTSGVVLWLTVPTRRESDRAAERTPHAERAWALRVNANRLTLEGAF
jgi:tetratricopeptide (TPR) repeat protein